MKIKENSVWYCDAHNHLIVVKYETKEVVYLFTDLLNGTYHPIDQLLAYYKKDFQNLDMTYIGTLDDSIA